MYACTHGARSPPHVYVYVYGGDAGKSSALLRLSPTESDGRRAIAATDVLSEAVVVGRGIWSASVVVRVNRPAGRRVDVDD